MENPASTCFMHAPPFAYWLGHAIYSWSDFLADDFHWSYHSFGKEMPSTISVDFKSLVGSWDLGLARATALTCRKGENCSNPFSRSFLGILYRVRCRHIFTMTS